MTDSSQALQLADYWAMIKARRWLVIVLTVVMAGAAGTVSAVQSPVYDASAVLALSQREIDSNQNVKSTALSDTQMSTQAALVTGDDVSRFARSRGATGTATATTKTETNLVTIVGTGATAQEAATTTDAFTDGFVAFRADQARQNRDVARRQLEDQRADIQRRIDAVQTQSGLADPLTPLGSLQNQQIVVESQLSRLQMNEAGSSLDVVVVSRAVSPAAPLSPKPLRDVLFGAVLGLLLGVGVAVLRGTLRTGRRAASTVGRGSSGDVAEGAPDETVAGQENGSANIAPPPPGPIPRPYPRNASMPPAPYAVPHGTYPVAVSAPSAPLVNGRSNDGRYVSR